MQTPAPPSSPERSWRKASVAAAVVLCAAVVLPGHHFSKASRISADDWFRPAEAMAALHSDPPDVEADTLFNPGLHFRNASREEVEEPVRAGLQFAASSRSVEEGTERIPPPTRQPDQKLQVLVGVGQQSMKRIRTVSEEELRDGLARVPVVGLRDADAQNLVKRYYGTYLTTEPTYGPELLLEVRPDLVRLPFHQGGQLRLDPKSAATLGELSGKLHAYVEDATPRNLLGQRPDPVLLKRILLAEKRGKTPEWLRPEVVPVLRQILMHEETTLRRLLVDLLAQIRDRRASVVLAERAVFDLSPDVRAAAVEALRSRSHQETLQVFLTALHYPWAPAADHAAEALVALNDRESVPALVTLLREPDPAAPVAGSRGRFYQRELVQVVHAANCLMCHPAALTARDPVPGSVPGWWLEDSVPATGRTPAPCKKIEPMLIRADITYFRQDFSETQYLYGIRRPGQPTLRLDYLVRSRLVAAKDVSRLQARFDRQVTYEQKEAVLFALRELTGQDAGTTYEDWLIRYPAAENDAVAARLIEEALQTPPIKRAQMLAKLRDGKGTGYSLALARLIPRVTDAERDKAREALAQRLGRMSADTLRDKLADDETEIRRAAARACGTKLDRELVPALMELLKDSQPSVRAQAGESLRALTGQKLQASLNVWQE
jgi:hypothetical protein